MSIVILMMTAATSIGGWIPARKLCGTVRLVLWKAVLVLAPWKWENWQRPSTFDLVTHPNTKV